MALAFVAGLWTAAQRGVRDGLTPEQVLDLGPWLIVGSILGARTLYVITFWRAQFASKPFPDVFMVWRGGLVFYGGLIGAALACILYARFRRISLWKLADAVAPSIALGYVFGRIGCLMNGCCYGRPCGLPWAITFGQAANGPPPGVPLHPTQLYDSRLNLGLYLALAALYRRKKYDGQVFATYLVGYALLRSFVEVFRGDYPVYQHFLGGWATPAQLVSIGILAGGLGLLVVLRRLSTAPPRGAHH